ncbi:hypothetical protein ABT112_19135 [Streptomyces sp. NPDC002055]|uniref:hypothetical protein n=1 Tax=Streptomyces sp. NPDC002055 TaxID=3154534 RepID=UPI00331E833A
MASLHAPLPPDGTGPTARDAMAGPGPRAGTGPTSGTTLPPPLGARAGRLLVRDEDGRRTGPVTGVRLTGPVTGVRLTGPVTRGRRTGPEAGVRRTVRQGESWHREKSRAWGIVHHRGPFTDATGAPVAGDHALGAPAPEASPVIDEHGYARGVLALSRCSFPGPVPPSDACEAPCASSSPVSRSI